MGLMSDLLKRGYNFASATGEKTGANLEDMVTRAVPVSGSEMVDQVFLTDAASATITDDAGDALRQFTIKDASITAAKIADGTITGAKLAATAMFGPSVAVLKAMFGFAGFASGSPLSDADLDLIVAANNTTASGALVTAANASSSIYSSLPAGATYLGYFMAKIRTTGVVSTIIGCSSLESPPTLTGGIMEFDTEAPFLSSTVTGTDKDAWIVMPFFGKTVGLFTSQGSLSTVSMKILRWAVFGNAVSNV